MRLIERLYMSIITSQKKVSTKLNLVTVRGSENQSCTFVIGNSNYAYADTGLINNEFQEAVESLRLTNKRGHALSVLDVAVIKEIIS